MHACDRVSHYMSHCIGTNNIIHTSAFPNLHDNVKPASYEAYIQVLSCTSHRRVKLDLKLCSLFGIGLSIAVYTQEKTHPILL